MKLEDQCLECEKINKSNVLKFSSSWLGYQYIIDEDGEKKQQYIFSEIYKCPEGHSVTKKTIIDCSIPDPE